MGFSAKQVQALRRKLNARQVRTRRRSAWYRCTLKIERLKRIAAKRSASGLTRRGTEHPRQPSSSRRGVTSIFPFACKLCQYLFAFGI